MDVDVLATQGVIIPQKPWNVVINSFFKSNVDLAIICW